MKYYTNKYGMIRRMDEKSLVWFVFGESWIRSYLDKEVLLLNNWEITKEEAQRIRKNQGSDLPE